jgi:hypothetical protein
LTVMTGHVDCDIVICGGNAKPTDVHLASTVRAIDRDIIRYLEKLERLRRRRKEIAE